MKRKFTLFSLPARLLFFVLVAIGLSPAKAQVTVNATAGTPTAPYIDLSSAFTAINNGTHQGDITIDISASFTDVASAVLHGNGTGTALYTSVLIRPVNDGITMSFATAGGRGVIELNGTDMVTLDGDNPNTMGTNRNLTIVNTASNTTTYTSVVRIATGTGAGYTDANNVTVKNCILNGSATGRNVAGTTSTTGSENTTFGIYAGGNGGATITALTSVTGNTAATTTTINTLLIDNNAVNQCARGIVFNGAGTAVSTGVTISNNAVGDQGTVSTTFPITTPANTVYTKAIWIAGTNAISITGNSIKNILSYVGTGISGVELNTAIGTGTIAINNNTINGVALNAASGNAARGISVQNAAGAFTVNQNTVTNIQCSDNTTAATAQPNALFIATSAPSATVDRNKFSTIINRNSGTFGVAGVFFNGGNNITYSNNFLNDVNQDISGGAAFNTTWGIQGLRILAGTGHKIYNNTIHLSGTFIGTATTNHLVSALTIAGTGLTGYDIRNNIFSNTMTGGTTSIAVVSMFLPSGATSALNMTVNNNAYYSGTTAGVHGIALMGVAGGNTYSAANIYTAANFNASATAPANNLRAYTSTLSAAGTNDNKSFAFSTAAPFVSSTDLHIPASPTITPLESGGASIAAVTNDIDGDVRPGPAGSVNGGALSHDIGADEFDGAPVPQCSGTPVAGNITGAAAVCTGLGTTLTFAGGATDPGISYQWASSTTPGGPYTTMLGTGTTQATGALTVPTYYIVTTTCSFSGMTSTTTEHAIAINALPTVAVSPTSATLCMPGGSPIALTASGANTYSWSPAAGLSATTGTTVNASPAGTTTYTVTGTDVNTCVNTATVTISVNPAVVVSATTATPSTICVGGNSQLDVNAHVMATAAQYVFTASTGATLDPMTGATTRILSSVDDQAMTTPAAIGFTFKYEGVDYTQFSASPDGWIRLGAGTAVNEWTNVVTSTTNIPRIYPIWDDLHTGSTGSVQTVVTGTAPNRIFIVQWFVTIPNSAGAANSTFQAWLYETSNKIEFRYGTLGGPATSASGGITGAIATNYKSITFSSNTASSTAANNSNTVMPAAGTMYTFEVPGPITYSWTPTTFLSDPSIESPMANAVTGTTAYTVTATANGCSATGNVTLTAGEPLVATITPSATTVCEGGNIILTPNVTGGGAPYTYSWDDGAGGSSTYINDTLSLADGSYTVTLTVTDACGSSTTATQAITFDPTPVVTASAVDDTLCAGGDVNLLATTDIGTDFVWTGPLSFFSSDQNPVIATAPATATGTYNVVAILGACTSPASGINIIVSPNPSTVTATSSLTGSVCAWTSFDLMGAATPDNGTLLMENFNGAAPGWTTINNSTGGTPADAAWTLRPSPYDPPGAWTGTISSNDNSQFYFTDGDDAGSGSTTNTILVSPAFSTSGFSSVDLNFWHFYKDIAAADDNGFLEISTDGTTWNNLATYTTDQGTQTAFANATFNLNSYLGFPSVQIRFRYEGTWDWGWAVDNLSVIGTPAPSYTYDWSSIPAGFTSTDQNPTGVVAMDTTAYVLTATNIYGCSLSDTVVALINPQPVVTAMSDDADNIICDGTGATVTLTGSGAAVYAWDNSVTDGVAFIPTTTTTYTVIGTDVNNCTDTTSITIEVNPTPTVAAASDDADNAVCDGSNVTLTGSGADSYAWDNSVNDGVAFMPAATTTYTVTGTTDGCSNTASITITVNDLPTVTANSDDADNTVCSGTSVTLTGGGASTYTWDNSVLNGFPFSAASTTTYTVTGTDINGCQNTASLTLTVNVVNITTSTAGFTITANATPATYQWINCGTGNSPIAGATSASYTATANGSYAAVVTQSGCSDTTACVTITGIGINELGNYVFALYPNPTTGAFTIEGAVEANVTVMGMQGEVVMSTRINAGKNQLNTGDIARGMYMVKIADLDGNIINMQRLVVTR